MPDWIIQEPTRDAIAEIVAFVDTARRTLFPLLATSPLPKDLAQFAETYLDGNGHFLVARDQGRLIAAIGYLPYDHRFAQLDYCGQRVVEVVRLFVLPGYRRHGLAGALVKALTSHAVAAGVECLYLHTHPFLPGAIGFWQGQGFTIVDVEADPVWQTTHMERVCISEDSDKPYSR
ncbi:GNAT family N-acetyltransferase [Pseudomonas putida]|uniref:GNAT family N-acetyltransferase n=1 Tax=Pseudomonas TaxID=286 RepID=UPI00105955F6|nr:MULTISPECIES: GNAT family N-acetyltransferase [Pseudomonas]MCT8165040.1 GNAT family N-acetyltransferase [Pseudomonas sp. HD6422]MCT8183938.1 GNAT family N-acetyltransferase [Pseudomonas sp. HD6421]TDJ77348.1 GNAT family N-acetyltransferase [Pseudomonas putida]